MITLTRLNNRMVVVNADLIRIIEATPDTLVTFVNGDTVLVRESIDEVVRLAVDYQRQVHGFRVV